MEERSYKKILKRRRQRPISGDDHFSDVEATSKPASLAITGGEGKVFISDKLQDHLNHVLIQQKYQQLAGEAAAPVSVINCCQVDKHGNGLFLSLKRVLDILREQNGLVHG